jgi:heme exporter protein A
MMPSTSSSPTEFSGADIRCIRGERVVFAGLSFAVVAGGALLLGGPNGSGKSSLLRVMAGLLPATAGVLRRDGADIHNDPESHRASLHYVGHLDAVKSVLSVTENLTFWAGMRSPDRDAARHVGAALDKFGLASLGDMPARLLSAGQRRRLSLARLIASQAPLWLLDEPTVALDAASVKIMVGCIADHRAGGGMVVLSTHIDLGIDAATTLALDDFSATAEFIA